MSASVANIESPVTLVKGGTVVTPCDQYEADILIRGETIAAIGRSLETRVDRTVDAKGCYVFPGAVNARDPRAGDLETAAPRALRGGVTTLLTCVGAGPNGGLLEGFLKARERSRGLSPIDYAFHVELKAFGERERFEIRELIEEEGVSSFEVSLRAAAFSDGSLAELLGEASCWGGLVNVCAEGEAPSFENRDLTGRALDVAHAGFHPLALAAVTFENTLHRVRESTLRNQRVFAATRAACLFDDAVRSPDDQDALWSGIRQGLIHMVTGGAHDYETLHSEGVAKGRLSLPKLVEICSSAPAKIFGLSGKGGVSVGGDADLVVFDPFATQALEACAGREFRGRVRTVLTRGTVALEDGQIREQNRGFGRCLARAKHLPDKL